MTSSSTPPAEEGPVWRRAQTAREAERRRPSFKRLIVNLISLGVAAAVIGFVLAPFTAFYAIRAAAQAGDVEGLAQLIDYDDVRASLRPQLSARPAPQTPPPSILEDPIGAIRHQFDEAVQPPAPAGPDTEAYLAPPALDALTRGAGREASRAGAGAGDPWPRPRYWGVNRARMSIRDTDGQGDTVFTFERRGAYQWVLVHVGLPERAGGPARAEP
jgi:hypothetical protein